MHPYNATPSEIEALKDYMYAEARDAKYYADLSRRRCAYGDSASLRSISEEESAHLKRLQAEYYILTGSAYFPCVAMIDIPCNYLVALRERFIEENRASEKYLEAAAGCSSKRLSSVYESLSAEELRHAEKMASAIADYMGGI